MLKFIFGFLLKSGILFYPYSNIDGKLYTSFLCFVGLRDDPVKVHRIYSEN